MIATDEDRVAMDLDRKTGLIDTILVDAVFDPNTGGIGPRYRLSVERWELGMGFPPRFSVVPEPNESGSPASAGGHP